MTVMWLWIKVFDLISHDDQDALVSMLLALPEYALTLSLPSFFNVSGDALIGTGWTMTASCKKTNLSKVQFFGKYLTELYQSMNKWLSESWGTSLEQWFSEFEGTSTDWLTWLEGTNPKQGFTGSEGTSPED